MFSDENSVRTLKAVESHTGALKVQNRIWVVCFMRQRPPFHYANILCLIHLPMAGGITLSQNQLKYLFEII